MPVAFRKAIFRCKLCWQSEVAGLPKVGQIPPPQPSLAIYCVYPGICYYWLLVKKFEIKAQNYAEVYDRFGKQAMHRVLPAFTNLLDTFIYHPNVNAAEEAKDFFRQSLEQKTPLIVVANHVQLHDHNVLNAALKRVPKLRKRLVGNTIVWSKAPHFQDGNLKRLVYSRSNVWPVFRDIDVKHELGNEDPMLVGRAATALINMSVNGIAAGRNVLFFPEGTRNLVDWGKVQPLQAGIGHLAFQAWRVNQDVGIVPIGIAYEDQSEKSLKNASVNIGEPLLYRNDRPSLVTATVRQALQECVDEAYSKLII